MWAAASAISDDESTPIRALDVHLMELDSAVVEREYKNIDLVIHVPAEKVVLAVELKIDAAEHSGQLGRYRQIIERDFPSADGWRQIFLFLTKRGDSPSDSDGAGWQTLPLESVAEMLERIADKGGGHPEARMMLNAYVGMLRRRHLTDQRMENLARDLWREHREALEFLMSRRPDMASEVFTVMLERQTEIASRFSEAAGQSIVPDHSTKTYVRFAVERWDAIPGMTEGTGWKPSNRMLIFEIYRDTKGGIKCQFQLGPGDPVKREALFRAFENGGADIGGKWALAALWRQLASKTLYAPKEDDSADEAFERVVTGAAQFLKTHVPRYDAAAKSAYPELL